MSILGFSPDCVTGAEEDMVNHASPMTFPKCHLSIFAQFSVKKFPGRENESIDDSKDKFKETMTIPVEVISAY